MLDPTHKAIIVLLHEGREQGIEIGVGPGFAIGGKSSKGTRLLLAEVKTSTIEATDRAIYHITTRDHDFMCRIPEHYSIRNWMCSYEETQVQRGSLSLEDCVIFGGANQEAR